MKRKSPIMKCIAICAKWLAVFAALMFAPMLRATNVQFNFSDAQGNVAAYTNVTVSIQPEQQNNNGAVTVLTPVIYQTTDTNGSTTFTNLAGNYSGGYYRWNVIAFSSPNGFNPPVASQGDIQITSSNLGTVTNTLVGVVFVPVYNGFGAAWTAQASDLRYSISSNGLANYVQIGTLNSTSNSIVALIPSTNGFVTTNILAGIATTNYANNLTNNFTSIVFSNPASFTAPTAVSNIVIAINSTNVTLPPAITNIAGAMYSNNPSGYITGSATNFAVGSNYVAGSILAISNNMVTNGIPAQVLLATNQMANTNLIYGVYVPFSIYTVATNALGSNALGNLQLTNTALASSINTASNTLFTYAKGVSNLLGTASQPASAILTNLAGTGAFTNAIAAGQNLSLTTNGSGTIITINATNQTWLTNGFTSIVFSNASAFIATNQLPALTNGFVTQTITNGLATIAYVNAQAGGGNVNTNQFAAGQNVSFTTNGSGTIISVNATNQTFLTNQLGQLSGVQPSTLATTNQTVALTNMAFGIGLGATNYANGIGQNDTNYIQSVSNSVTTGVLFDVSQTNVANMGATTNLIATAGASSTNYANSLAATVTNNINAASNSILTIYNAGTNTIYQAATNVSALNSTAVTNGGNLVFTNNSVWSNLVANGFNYVASTNGTANNLTLQGVEIFGTKTNRMASTNIIDLGNAGSPGIAGQYVGVAGFNVLTNAFNPTNTIIYSGGIWNMQSNNVTLYSSTNVMNWTPVNGIAPAPLGGYGFYVFDNSAVYLGWVYSTNIYWQITNAIFQFAGASSGIQTNNGFGAGTTLTNAAVITVTNLNINNVGAGNGSSGVITFPHGDTIAEYSGGSGQYANDTGIAIGLNNSAPLYENYSTIVGGASNDVTAPFLIKISGATILGGFQNKAAGNFSTIVGGQSNKISTAGNGSTIIGTQGSVTHSNVLMLTDGSQVFTSAMSNTLIANFSGGIGLGTNNPAGYAINIGNMGNGSINVPPGSGFFAGGIQVGGSPTNGATPATVTNIALALATNSSALALMTNIITGVGYGNPPYNFDIIGQFVNTYGGTLSIFGTSVEAGGASATNNSAGFGEYTVVTGAEGFGAGYNAQVSGAYADAFGANPTASGLASFAAGYDTLATNDFSVVFNLDDMATYGSVTDRTFTVNAPNGINLWGSGVNLNGQPLGASTTVVSNIVNNSYYITNQLQSGGASVLNKLYVTNAFGNVTGLNGIYTVNNGFIYTNASGYGVLVPANYQATPHTSTANTYYRIATNLTVLGVFPYVSNFFSSASLLGTYSTNNFNYPGGWSGDMTNVLTVSQYSTTTYDPAGAAAAIGTTSAANMTNAANQFTGTFTGNGAGLTNVVSPYATVSSFVASNSISEQPAINALNSFYGVYKNAGYEANLLAGDVLFFGNQFKPTNNFTLAGRKWTIPANVGSLLFGDPNWGVTRGTNGLQVDGLNLTNYIVTVTVMVPSVAYFHYDNAVVGENVDAFNSMSCLSFLNTNNNSGTLLACKYSVHAGNALTVYPRTNGVGTNVAYYRYQSATIDNPTDATNAFNVLRAKAYGNTTDPTPVIIATCITPEVISLVSYGNGQYQFFQDEVPGLFNVSSNARTNLFTAPVYSSGAMTTLRIGSDTNFCGTYFADVSGWLNTNSFLAYNTVQVIPFNNVNDTTNLVRAAYRASYYGFQLRKVYVHYAGTSLFADSDLDALGQNIDASSNSLVSCIQQRNPDTIVKNFSRSGTAVESWLTNNLFASGAFPVTPMTDIPSDFQVTIGTDGFRNDAGNGVSPAIVNPWISQLLAFCPSNNFTTVAWLTGVLGTNASGFVASNTLNQIAMNNAVRTNLSFTRYANMMRHITQKSYVLSSGDDVHMKKNGLVNNDCVTELNYGGTIQLLAPDTNWVSGATGWTNITGQVCTARITAGTSVQQYDFYGNYVGVPFTTVTYVPLTMEPGSWFIGTGITATISENLMQ